MESSVLVVDDSMAIRKILQRALRQTGMSIKAIYEAGDGQEALNLLPPKQRAAVILTLVEGMTQAEAAAMLGCPEKTLSWRMSSARRRLEKLMREEDPAP